MDRRTEDETFGIVGSLTVAVELAAGACFGVVERPACFDCLVVVAAAEEWAGTGCCLAAAASFVQAVASFDPAVGRDCFAAAASFAVVAVGTDCFAAASLVVAASGFVAFPDRASWAVVASYFAASFAAAVNNNFAACFAAAVVAWSSS